MNERIKELAEQAEKLAEDELVHLERVHNRLYSFTESREIYNQKFAELIVAECARVLDDKLANPNGASMAYCDGSDLLEHFGVEE